VNIATYILDSLDAAKSSAKGSEMQFQNIGFRVPGCALQFPWR